MEKIRRLGDEKDVLTEMSQTRDNIKGRPEQTESAKQVRILCLKLLDDAIAAANSNNPEVSYCWLVYRRFAVKFKLSAISFAANHAAKSIFGRG